MSNLDKICSTCKERLPKEKFRRINRNNWSGFYPKCKNCESILMRSRYEKNPIPQMLSNAKIRAKRKNVDFNLTSSFLKKIFPKNNKCPVTGFDFQFGYKNFGKRNKDFAPSLDRIVPEKGYVEGNVIVICDIANRIKSDSTFEILEKVYKFYKKLKTTDK